MFPMLWRGWRKGISRTVKRGQASGAVFKPTLELLEDRVVPSFAGAVPYTIGTTDDGFVPNAADVNIAAGNFTGNGITDLVVAHTSDDSLYFLRGNGNGTFQSAVKIATFSKPIDGDVFVGDFNGDGKLDLFVPTVVLSPASSYPIILMGNGDGTFQAPIYSSQSFFPASLNGSGSYVRGWAIADINGDGKQDLVANVVGEGVTAMLGNGDGTFQAPIFTPVAMGYSRWVAAGDFNGDGKADLAIADGNGTNNQTGNSELTILLSNGDGTFRLEGHSAAPPTPDAGGDGMGGGDVVNPEDVMVADLRNDGKLDVVESLYDHSIDVFLGNGDGTFQSAVGYTTGEYPRAVVAADVNGNGIMDLVVDNVGVGPGGAAAAAEGLETGSIAVLMGNGDGTFNPTPIQYTSTYFPGWMAVSDFNGDGLPDLATTLVSKGNEVDVTLNQLGTGAPTLTTPASAVGYLADEPGTVYTNSVPGTTINLSVLGTDPGSDAGPIYSWSLISKPSGAASPTFSINNSNAAGNTTATFTQAGLYDFLVTISDPSSGESITSSVQALIVVNQAPTVGTAASASPATVNGTTTNLSVLGADDSGYLNLTYTWATTGTPPAAVIFGPSSFVYNNVGIGVATNVTTATFSKAGTYSLQVTMTDPEGKSTISSVTVVVNQLLTSIVLTPAVATVTDGGTQQFSALGMDQFGNPMASQPTFTWSSTGPGSVNGSGLYTAPGSGTGSATVKAKLSSLSATATVTITAGQPPVVTTPASASPDPVTGVNTNLSVAATDPQGQTLTYTWATTGTSPDPVSFGSGNGTAAGNNITATFTQAGTYSFQVTITNTSGLSMTSSVTVSVSQVLTSIVVNPTNSTVTEGNTQQFNASGLDQFGTALVSQPSFTWSVSGIGSVSGSGLYTAPGAIGSATVTATSGTLSDSAGVTVIVGQFPPSVTDISPSVGPISGGTSVVLTGTNFNGATAVYFGNMAASSFTVNSATQITVTTPAESAATVDITVTTAGGTSTTSAADHFTYQAANLDTWTGLGATNNWSDAGNWSKDAAPGSGDTVVFDGHSGNNAIVDSAFAGTVAAVQINTGYIGTISLSRNLTVAGAFAEQAGTYSDGSFTTTVTGLTIVSGGNYQSSTTADTFTGGLTVSGGTFTGSTGTVTTANVTLSSGTLNAPSGNLDVTGGNFTVTNGTFNADAGTVTYSGSGTPTVSATGAKFYNFADALAAYPSTITINGTLTTTGTFSILGSARTINGNIEAQGNVDDENHGGIGNPFLALDGNANQTIEDLSGGGGGQFRTITINKTGGTVNLAANPTVFSGLTFTAGTVNTGVFSWILGSLGPVSAASGLNLGNIEINGSVTVSSASLQVANVTFAAASDSFKAPTASLFVSGNWNNSVGGSFTPNGGTVVFDGTGSTQQMSSGGKAFNNLTIAAGASVILEVDLTYTGTFINNGTFNPNGHKVNGH